MDADELEFICTLGRGAYGVVDKMKHKQSDTIMAVKVSTCSLLCYCDFFECMNALQCIPVKKVFM